MVFSAVNKGWLPIAMLALVHGINDFFAGYLLAVINITTSPLWAGSAYVFYVAVAFGGQLLFALWVDKTNSYKTHTIAALLLLLAAILSAGYLPLVAIAFSAFASGIYHVSAPPVCMGLTNNKATATGLFAAPGVAGLALGGSIGYTLQLPIIAFVVAAIVVATTVALVFSLNNTFVYTAPKVDTLNTKPGLDTHDYLMILLLLVVALRSAVWDIFQMAYSAAPEWLIYIAIAAAVGKVLGGMFSEKYNNPLVLTFTLALATVLLHLQQFNKALLLAGIVLLQSTIPASIMLFYRFMPAEPALANSLVMGLAVVLGSFPYFIGFNQLYMLVGVGATLLVLSWAFTRYYKRTVLH